MAKFRITNIDEDKNHVTFDILIEGDVIHSDTRGDLDITNVDHLKAQLSDYAIAIADDYRATRKQSQKVKALVGKEVQAKSPEERALDPVEEDVAKEA